ncbi:hypothetical protein [Variovorax sp. UC122_21]|uniref:hypothetical protein n=1 Tax=Variovorax sp. UC122_21 TaxID=3374554 RepID=UPI0037575075
MTANCAPPMRTAPPGPLLSTVTVPALPVKIANPSCCQVALSVPLTSVQLVAGRARAPGARPPAILPSLMFALSVPSRQIERQAVDVQQVDLVRDRRSAPQVARIGGRGADLQAVVGQRAGVVDEAVEAPRRTCRRPSAPR